MISNFNEFDFSKVWEHKYVKVTIVIISGIVAIFLAGHVFKIMANTINGFKEFQRAVSS